jgi:hypothetical protein
MDLHPPEELGRDRTNGGQLLRASLLLGPPRVTRTRAQPQLAHMSHPPLPQPASYSAKQAAITSVEPRSRWSAGRSSVGCPRQDSNLRHPL